LGKEDRDSFCIREVDNVIVKGKSKSIKIYEVMSLGDKDENESRYFIKEEFERGLQLYQNKQFHEASLQFQKLQDDQLSKIYIERCKYFIENPPHENWDGTFVMGRK
jgi:adenylate cyclase